LRLNHHREGRGETVVLIHGVGSFWQAWRPVIDALGGQRDVIALDLPGFGSSPTLPIGVVPDARALAGAVADFLEGLGVERPIVGGNSLGGWVGLELARRGRARAVVGVSPAGFAAPLESKLARAQLRAAWHSALRTPELTEQLLRRPRGRALAFGNLVGHPDRTPASEAISATRNLAASPGFDATVNVITKDRLRDGDEIGVPVTLVWGTRDMILFPWQAKRALRELPRARLVQLPGAGHVPMWDEPGAIARELLSA
jgi:pimeloyl-ACP methyl ester carboxylesterase